MLMFHKISLPSGFSWVRKSIDWWIDWFIRIHLVPLKWPVFTSLYTCSSTRLLYPGSNVYQQWSGPDSAGDLIWPNVELDRASSRSAFMVMLHTEKGRKSVWWKLHKYSSMKNFVNIIRTVLIITWYVYYTFKATAERDIIVRWIATN